MLRTVKKLLLVLALISPAFAQTTHTFPALDTNNTFTGNNTVLKFIYGEYLAAAKPTPVSSMTIMVTDGATAIDCTTGLGSSRVMCQWNGSAWVAVNGGAAPGANRNVIFNNNGVFAGSNNFTFNSSTGELALAGSGSGCIEFLGSTSGSATICAAAVAGSPNQINLPTTTGTSGQALTTNGGSPQQLSWATIAATPASPATSVQFNDGGSFGGNSGFTFDKTLGAVTILAKANTVGQALDVNTDTTVSAGMVAFTGAGLNDATFSGTWPSDLPIVVEIDGTGPPNTFKWTVGVEQANSVAITGSTQYLAMGLSVRFGATTGHTSGNKWTVTFPQRTLFHIAGDTGGYGVDFSSTNNATPEMVLYGRVATRGPYIDLPKPTKEAMYAAQFQGAEYDGGSHITDPIISAEVLSPSVDSGTVDQLYGISILAIAGGTANTALHIADQGVSASDYAVKIDGGKVQLGPDLVWDGVNELLVGGVAANGEIFVSDVGGANTSDISPGIITTTSTIPSTDSLSVTNAAASGTARAAVFVATGAGARALTLEAHGGASASVGLEIYGGTGGGAGTATGIDVQPLGVGSTVIGIDIENQGTANTALRTGTGLVLHKDTVQILPASFAFADLPTCNGGAEGSLRPVNNSNTAVWGATVSGTGANHILAYCDGSNWTVAAK